MTHRTVIFRSEDGRRIERLTNEPYTLRDFARAAAVVLIVWAVATGVVWLMMDAMAAMGGV